MDNKKVKGSAYSQPDYIKPKSKWTKKTTIWVIVIAVIVLGILAIIGAENGWFKTADMINGKIELDDYSTIEINESDVEVTDENIQSYLDSVVSSETTTETVTEGTVEDGDTVVIDYSGVLEGETDPFEGGTAEDQSLTLGSGSMIDGFEDQIVGHEIGETFDIDVTFPDDYSTEDLQGKKATFTITIDSKTVTNEPELTDDLILQYTTDNSNFDEPISTIEDFKAYYRDRLYNSKLESAITSAMAEKTHITYYNEADLANMTTYAANTLSYYATSVFGGIDAETCAAYFGYDSAAAYAETTAKNTLTTTMMLDKVAEEQGITYTQEEVDEVLQKYLESADYDGTLDEFKEASGEAYVFIVTETEVLMPKVMDYLKGNVVFVESEEETSEATAETTEANDAAETSEASEDTTAAEDAETSEIAEDTTSSKDAETSTAKETTKAAAEETSAADDAETTTAAANDDKTAADVKTTEAAEK